MTENALSPLPPPQYEALKADIAEHGIRVPIQQDEDGHVIDGHHRRAIAEELGIDCPSTTVAGLSECEREEHAIVVNLLRRHMDADDRKAAVKRLIHLRGGTRPRGRPKNTSPDAINDSLPKLDDLAAELGVSRSTIERDLADEPRRERTDTDRMHSFVQGVIYNVTQMESLGFDATDRARWATWHEDLTEIAAALDKLVAHLGAGRSST